MKLKRRFGRVRLTEEALADLSRNKEALRAYAKAMSPFIVIKAEYNQELELYEQLLYDPLGIRFEEVRLGDVVPDYAVCITKCPVMTLFDSYDEYTASLIKRS